MPLLAKAADHLMLPQRLVPQHMDECPSVRCATRRCGCARSRDVRRTRLTASCCAALMQRQLFNPPLPEDVAVEFFVSYAQLVIAVYVVVPTGSFATMAASAHPQRRSSALARQAETAIIGSVLRAQMPRGVRSARPLTCDVVCGAGSITDNWWRQSIVLKLKARCRLWQLSCRWCKAPMNCRSAHRTGLTVYPDTSLRLRAKRSPAALLRASCNSLITVRRLSAGLRGGSQSRTVMRRQGGEMSPRWTAARRL